jgi:hypothetical protein
LRLASCCSEEVVKGAAGRRVYGLDSSEVTVAGVAPRVSTSSRAEASVSTVALFERGLRVPSSAKSLPVRRARRRRWRSWR